MFGEGALDNYSKDPELEKLIAEGGNTSDKAVRAKAYPAAIKIDREGLLAADQHLREHLRLRQVAGVQDLRRRAAALLSGEVEVK